MVDYCGLYLVVITPGLNARKPPRVTFDDFPLRAGCQEHPPLSALVSDTGAAIVFPYPPVIKRGSEILNK